jgi:cardiolipin synthase (CMP-forming)
MWPNLPNLLTIIRILLVPVVVWALSQQAFALAFTLFVAAGITDGLDGYLARRFNWHSALGAILDPLADKALLVSIYVTLAVLRELPVWLAMLVVTRDVLIVGAVLLARFLQQDVDVRPAFVSKANTVAQIVFAAYILAHLAFDFRQDQLVLAGSHGVAFLTVASLGVYMRRWLAQMGSGKGGRAE